MDEYHCSACDAIISSEGNEGFDHMVAQHGVDPEIGCTIESPYLIPVKSNPVLDNNGVPDTSPPEPLPDILYKEDLPTEE